MLKISILILTDNGLIYHLYERVIFLLELLEKILSLGSFFLFFLDDCCWSVLDEVRIKKLDVEYADVFFLIIDLILESSFFLCIVYSLR
jgi:hypothetical protein